MAKNSEYKTRNWVTVIYPESEKPGWRDILASWCVQAFVSPLHQFDANPDGEVKKAHYHVMLMMDGPKARGLMEKRMEELGGVGCQPCNSARGYARYLCHLDNPEKHQYDPADVESFGGADYMGVIELETDRRKVISEMMDWCRENHVVSFYQLCDYARTEKPDTWFRVLNGGGMMIMYRYLRSMEYEALRPKD